MFLSTVYRAVWNDRKCRTKDKIYLSQSFTTLRLQFNVSMSLELSSTNKAFLCWQTFIASMKTLRASADWKISRYRLLRFFGMPECWKYSCIRRHCMKSVSIRSYSGPHFHAFRLNKDQKNSEYGHYLRSAFHLGAGPYFNQLLETQSFFNVFRRYRNGTLN